jgi:hypothetical protein
MASFALPSASASASASIPTIGILELLEQYQYYFDPQLIEYIRTYIIEHPSRNVESLIKKFTDDIKTTIGKISKDNDEIPELEKEMRILYLDIKNEKNEKQILELKNDKTSLIEKITDMTKIQNQIERAIFLLKSCLENEEKYLRYINIRHTRTLYNAIDEELEHSKIEIEDKTLDVIKSYEQINIFADCDCEIVLDVHSEIRSLDRMRHPVWPSNLRIFNMAERGTACYSFSKIYQDLFSSFIRGEPIEIARDEIIPMYVENIAKQLTVSYSMKHKDILDLQTAKDKPNKILKQIPERQLQFAHSQYSLPVEGDDCNISFLMRSKHEPDEMSMDNPNLFIFLKRFCEAKIDSHDPDMPIYLDILTKIRDNGYRYSNIMSMLINDIANIHSPLKISYNPTYKYGSFAFHLLHYAICKKNNNQLKRDFCLMFIQQPTIPNTKNVTHTGLKMLLANNNESIYDKYTLVSLFSEIFESATIIDLGCQIAKDPKVLKRIEYIITEIEIADEKMVVKKAKATQKMASSSKEGGKKRRKLRKRRTYKKHAIRNTQ